MQAKSGSSKEKCVTFKEPSDPGKGQELVPVVVKAQHTARLEVMPLLEVRVRVPHLIVVVQVLCRVGIMVTAVLCNPWLS